MRALALAFALLAVPAWAETPADTSEVFRFPDDATEAEVCNTLTGPQRREYLLDAKAGQRFAVTLQSDASATITVVGPDGSPLFNGMMAEGAAFDGVLPETGRYSVRAYQLGDDASAGRTAAFTLSFVITG